MGNYGCGCSDFVKDDSASDRPDPFDLEEVVEFQPQLYKNYRKDSVPATNLSINNEKSQSVIESKNTGISESSSNEIQGELMKYQMGAKEIMVPRWCVLTGKTFRYFKNQYSALCKDKALFEVQTDRINWAKAYSKHGRYFFEISLGSGMYQSSGSSSAISLHSMKLNGSQNNDIECFTNKKTLSHSGAIGENVVFVVPSKKEWELWKAKWQMCIKLTV